MSRQSAALLVAAVLALGGCSAMRDTFGGWFGGSPSSDAERDAPQRETFYAAADNLQVHAEASSSSAVSGRLARGDKVTRTRLERGYAFVIVEKSGLEGWVDNAQLDWRVPPVSAPSAAPAKGSAATATVEAAAVPTPTSTPADAVPPPIAPAVTPVAEPKMFDPY